MSEEKQVSNEPVGNVDTPPTEVANADASVIAESKKYRKRSQAAEARVAELEAQINSFETDKLKEKEEFKVLVKLRNSSQPVLGNIKVNFDKNFANLSFKEPQFGVSIGQAAVFYNIKEASHVLGGGWITEAPNKLADIKL